MARRLPPALRAWLRLVPGHGALRLLYRLAKGAETRHAALLMLRRPAGLFQPFADTRPDRYPALFALVREHVGDGDGVRLLSFGCATGDEVLSLRRVFPSAHIRGLDIAAANIARARTSDPRLDFAIAADAGAEPEGAYDAVFAMAVFRHGDLESRPPSCAPLIRFATFERTIAGLARCLRPGGLLVIRHAHFRFMDTGAAAGFDPVLTLSTQPLYGRDDRLLEGAHESDGVFRKR